jgi:hypothetical protein
MNTPPQVSEHMAPTAPIVARAGRYYRNARYLMFAIIVGMGGWFMYDGFVKYPESNRVYDDLVQKLAQMEKDPNRDEATYLSVTLRVKSMSRHEEFSILLQKLLGFTLPIVGIGLLIYWLKNSRGEIRLENGVLTLPGSPAVPLSSMDELDKELWDRKGIATVYYTLDDNTTGKFLLDDFVYQAHPIRAIVKAIEGELQAQDEIIARAEQEQQEREKQLREEQEKQAKQQAQKDAATPAQPGGANP